MELYHVSRCLPGIMFTGMAMNVRVVEYQIVTSRIFLASIF
jgi:hypothetical protein